MTERQARIAIPEDEPELAIVGLSIARAFEDRGARWAMVDGEGDALELAASGQRLMLRWDGARGQLVDRDWPLVLTPAVHPGLLSSAPVSRRRVTFRCETDSRRLRMIERIVRELRRRGFDGSIAAAGRCDVEWLDESFSSLNGMELLRLLASSRVTVDTCSEDEPPHLLTQIAIACGYPVITSAPTSGQTAGHVRRIEEWSADAFAEAIVSSPASGPPPSRAGIDAVVDEIEKALALG